MTDGHAAAAAADDDDDDDVENNDETHISINGILDKKRRKLRNFFGIFLKQMFETV